MKTWTLTLLVVVALVPSTLLAQRGGFGGGMGGMGYGSMPRFDPPDLPGAELEGPPDSAAAGPLLGLAGEQLQRYVQAYSAFMKDTKPQRDSINAQLGTMEEKLSAGDRAAALFYAERATRISKGLKDRQEDWEDDTLFKLLTGDQVKVYKRWKKENEDAVEERQKRDAMRWNPMLSGVGGDRPEQKTSISAPVGIPAGSAAAVRAGGTIYLAGQVAVDAEGNIVGENDLRAQAVKAFANLTAVLQAARARPADVVRLTVYVVNYQPQDLALIREVAAAYLPQADPPALTVLGVQSLYREGLLISVEATALAGGGAGSRGVRER